MKRALLPWLLPAAVLVGLLAAATGSPIVWALALVVVLGAALRLLSSLNRSGELPRMFQGDGDGANMPRWLQFDPGRDRGDSPR